MKNKKVVVAMSGGVDSSVAAAILKKEGYNVVGVFMQFWFPSPAEASAKEGKPGYASAKATAYEENRCCSLESWREAQAVAKILNIPIYKVNFGRQFKKIIVDEFLSEYRAGHTPNPCVNCNKFIKFDLLLKYARTVFGADYLATGHYVSLSSSRRKPGSRVNKTKSRIGSEMAFNLRRSKDKNKDQSYFLYNLKQDQLKHLLFPLGDYTKEEVRRLAKKLGLPVHQKKDSQEICFVSTTVNDFLKKYLKLKSGNIADEKGKIIGKHLGLPLYTLGQRSGIGLSGGPWYVSGFDRKKNQLIVTKNQKKSNIFKKELRVEKVNWIRGESAFAPAVAEASAGKVKFPLSCEAQIRYHAKMAKCVVKKRNGLKVKFAVPQRAIMPGQSVVFYNKNELLGGGVIV